MRTLTANYLESHSEHFSSFHDGPYEEVLKDVLTSGKEAEGVAVGPL